VPLAVRGSAILLAFAVAVFAAAVLRTSARTHAPVATDAVIDIPPIPGDVARALTFGFRPLLADFTLLQAIQLLPLRHGDMPPEIARMLLEETRKSVERGESLDSLLNRVFGSGPGFGGRRKKGRRR